MTLMGASQSILLDRTNRFLIHNILKTSSLANQNRRGKTQVYWIFALQSVYSQELYLLFQVVSKCSEFSSDRSSAKKTWYFSWHAKNWKGRVRSASGRVHAASSRHSSRTIHHRKWTWTMKPKSILWRVCELPIGIYLMPLSAKFGKWWPLMRIPDSSAPTFTKVWSHRSSRDG